MTDFEKAAQAAVSYHFPRTALRGCAFHYAQCIWRHFVDCGLKSAYSRDQELKKWLKKVIALHLIPADKVETCWERLIDDCNEFHYQGLTKFLDYFTATWIEGVLLRLYIPYIS